MTFTLGPEYTERLIALYERNGQERHFLSLHLC